MVRLILPAATAIAAGLLVLLDMFFDNPYLNVIGWALTDWAALLAAFALLIGAYNLSAWHLRRLGRRERGWPYSVVLLIALATTLVLGLISPQGTEGETISWAFWNVLFPLQATFFALLAFFVAIAAYRAFQVRRPEVILLVLAGLVVLLGQIPLGGALSDLLPEAANWIVAVPATAGVRGILIGVALGTVATGLRLLMGIEKPYAQ
jgi:hypothetical protein